MFGWFPKAFISQVRYFLAITWWERWQNIRFLVFMLLVLVGFSRKRKGINSFYNIWDLLSFPQLKKIVFFNHKMARVILDPKHKGIKAWEYGQFLSRIKLKKGMKVLDVGSGNSALPFYLAKKGLKVVAFDLEIPMEKPNQDLMKRYPKVTYKSGSMLKLPFKSSEFGLVLCISAIEHLDYLPDLDKTIPYRLFIKRTRQALKEMMRVLKPGGRLFLTTDVYFKFQVTDRWPQAYLHKGIGTAYRKEDFQKIFLDTIKGNNFSLIGEHDFDFNQVLKDSNRSIYRGRYFTTFSIYAKKN